jgi:hypothetical protein
VTMTTIVTSPTQFPTLFRLFGGTLEQAQAKYPKANIYHYVGGMMGKYQWKITVIEANNEVD